MKKLCGNGRKRIKQILKAYENHKLLFQKYGKSNRDILRTFRRHSLIYLFNLFDLFTLFSLFIQDDENRKRIEKWK